MLVYNLSIRKPIQLENEPRIKGVKYADSWSDYKGMGISVISWYNYNADKYGYHLGDKKGLISFDNMIKGIKVFAGFNNIGFDNKLLRAHGINIFDERSYDILRQLPDKIDKITNSNYSLNTFVKVNFGKKIYGNGADVPLWWQEGKTQKVIDYCVMGIKLTRLLLDKIIKTGKLTSPKTKREITVERPR